MRTDAGLPGRVVSFVEAMRAAGLPVGVSESVDATRVIGAVDLLEREQLREGLAAALVKRGSHRPTFDTLFDLWFPALVGESVAGGSELVEGGLDLSGLTPPTDLASRAELSAQLREALRQLLLRGDDDDLRRFAREAVRLLGQADVNPGQQGFFSYRVLRALSPETLMASLLDGVLAPMERGGFAEQVARRDLGARVDRFGALVDEEVRRRLAEERGPERVAKTAVRPLPQDVDFLRATQADLAELRRQVLPLSRRLATRLAQQRRHGRRGRLDVRRTLRASLATGGVPVVTHHRPPRPHKPELVLLCDVSGSVSAFARFTLMLSYALREQFTKVRAFAFVDTCDEVTALFAGGDFADSARRLAEEANVVWFDGHSDYGHSFEVFADRYADAIGPRTSLLVLGDARNNYRPTGAATLHALAARAKHAYWLNPEPRAQWGSGDSAALAYAPHVDAMVECRTATQLEQWLRTLMA